MPYIFVRSEMNQRKVDQVFGETTTYIDFDQNSSPDFTQLAALSLNCVNATAYGWKTYETSVPAYVVLNALETCAYKVVAASSTAIGNQYMWTLQGSLTSDVLVGQKKR